MVKADQHIFMGMQKDSTISNQDPKFLWDAHNIRITAREGDTLVALTNEKGTELASGEMTGKCLGYYAFSDCCIIFTHSDSVNDATPDRIYKFTPGDDTTESWEPLYKGNLNLETPIEAIGVQEREDIKKVYWVDGKNSPRVINIDKIRENDDKQFDFIPTLALGEKVEVTRIDGRGSFSPGTIQYAFSYFYKYGQESNIFLTTPLQYISFPDRGGAPTETVACSFRIDITGLETKFDYLRIYSIRRTSYDGVPQCRIVEDIELSKSSNNNTLTFIDDGSKGEIIDNTRILYAGGWDIVAGTMCNKDGVLFLGNLQLKQNAIENSVVELLDANKEHFLISSTTKGINTQKTLVSDGVYRYTSNLPVTPGFKANEHYRLGIQFQDYSGRWTEPYWVGDHTEEEKPEQTIDNGTIKVTKPTFNIELRFPEAQDEDPMQVINQYYAKVRPVCVFPNVNDRLVLTQGLLNPTVFSIRDRWDKSLFAQSSWFYRPTSQPTDAAYNWAHNVPLGHDNNDSLNFSYPHMEIQGSQVRWGLRDVTVDTNTKLKYLTEEDRIGGNINHSRKEFGVDQSIITLNSPEVEFDPLVQTRTLDSNYKLSIVGFATFPNNATEGNYLVETATPTTAGDGLLKERLENNKPILTSLLYEANGIAVGKLGGYGPTQGGKSDGGNLPSATIFDWALFPWQGEGSLTNDDREAGEAILRKKILAQCHFSDETHWIPDVNPGTGKDNILKYTVDAKLVLEHNIMTRLRNPYSLTDGEFDDITYKGDIDTLLFLDYPKYTITIKDGDASISIDSSISDEWDFTIAKYVSGKLTRDNDNSSKKHLPANLTDRWMYHRDEARAVFGLTTAPSDDFNNEENYWGDDAYIIPTNFTPKYNGHKYPAGYPKNGIRPLVTKPMKRPIRLRYKSSPHIVLSLLSAVDERSGNRLNYILPHLQGYTNILSPVGTTYKAPYWMFNRGGQEGSEINPITISSFFDADTPTNPNGTFNAYSAAAKDFPADNIRIELDPGDITVEREEGGSTVEIHIYPYEGQDGPISGQSVEFEKLGLITDEWLVELPGYLYILPHIESINETTPMGGNTIYSGNYTDPLSEDSILVVRPFSQVPRDTIMVMFDYEPTQGTIVKHSHVYKRDSDNSRMVLTPDPNEPYQDTQMGLWSDLLRDCGYDHELSYMIDKFIKVKDGNYYQARTGANGAMQTWIPLLGQSGFTGEYYVDTLTPDGTPSSIYDGLAHYQIDVEPEHQPEHPHLLIGELVREADANTDFGGTSSYALRSNRWNPAGEAVSLDGSSINIEVTEGDTWFQRHDCLKTYPYSMDDKNSIVEIGSFMCETRVNLDGRFDKIKNLVSRTAAIDNTVMNSINSAYSQPDNYFNYRILDEDLKKTSIFNNQITWSLQKNDTALVDEWTRVNLGSVLNLDATKGDLTALRVFNDQIFAFQEKAVSIVNFNSRVQIPTSDGVPVEITNNMKVDGYKVLLDGIGCSNKKSICITPGRAYFIENTSGQLYAVGGEAQGELSEALRMSEWFKGKRVKGKSCETYYDYQHKDLYLNYRDECLVYSAPLNQFTSFMDYYGVSAMFNIGPSFYSIYGQSVYKMFAGEYNYFFNEYKPYDFTFISNNLPYVDKTFTNIEMRVDFLEGKEKPDSFEGIIDKKCFDYIEVENEYQSRHEELHPSTVLQTNCVKKFRQWRIEIPRAGLSMNRFRNNWVRIKLGVENNSEKRDNTLMHFHDLIVYYHI